MKPTFSEVSDTKNINETDKEAKHRSIASLVLMLVRYVRQKSILLMTSKKSTYVIVPVSDEDCRSRDLYGDSDTVGKGSE